MAPNALHGRYAAVCRVSLRARAQASRRSDFPERQVPERLWIRLPEAAPLRSAARSTTRAIELRKSALLSGRSAKE